MSEERIIGTVKRVIYESPEGDYVVVRVEDEEGRETVLVGHLPGVSEGMRVDAWVKRELHPKYGIRFRVESAILGQPRRGSDLAAYLMSGKVKGIGPKMARAIVEYFGEELREVLDKEPERLKEVPGIGEKKARAVIEAWRQDQERGEVVSHLMGAGLSYNLAMKVFETYGEKALHIVMSDPYRLVRDIWGIGFKTADQIARQIGIDPLSSQRIGAGIMHVLGKASEDGHCYVPKESLVSRTSSLLEVEEWLVEVNLGELINKGRIVEISEKVALAWLYNTEASTAVRLKRMAAEPFAGGEVIGVLLRRFQGRLHEEQIQAAERVLEAGVGILTGGPGTGKTTLIRAMAQAAKAAGFRIALASPTGRAAQRLKEATGLEATTIHRLLEFDPRTLRFNRNAKRPLDKEWVIVDEASMVDTTLMGSLIEALGEGTNLTLVGDRNQLPPVGPGAPFHDMIRSGVLPIGELFRVFRQRGHSQIIEVARGILEGIVPRPSSKGAQGDFYYIREEDPTRIVRIVVELVSSRIPKAFGIPPYGIQVLVPTYKGVVGANELNRSLRQALMGDVEGRFVPGDRVIQVRNNYDKEVFNGDIGRVLRAGTQEVVVDFDGREVTYASHQLDELQLAYAITIHKAQGSEFPAVVVVLSTHHMVMLQRSLLYTGITRGKQLVVLVGHPYAVRVAVENEEGLERNTFLYDLLRD